jgi:UDP-2,3-diacylglucosamine pyrophosphatase LpxH
MHGPPNALHVTDSSHATSSGQPYSGKSAQILHGAQVTVVDDECVMEADVVEEMLLVSVLVWIWLQWLHLLSQAPA